MPKLETPPRTWGRLYFFLLFSLGRRNTPTHVGKTQGLHPRPTHSQKHPHARGEDLTYRSTGGRARETPPRTWGRLTQDFRAWQGWRNTPTHVGKTRRRLSQAFQREKHPHARGEDVSKPSLTCIVKETPPRTWGRQLKVTSDELHEGNTPTHVGKTLASASSSPPVT